MANPTTKPGKPIDDTVLAKLAGYGASYDELASLFQTTKTWLYNNKREIIEDGKNAMKIKLRQKQLQIAFNDTHKGQTTMLIFLGKVILGQQEPEKTVNVKTDKEYAGHNYALIGILDDKTDH
jgi:hypothetical protein